MKRYMYVNACMTIIIACNDQEPWNYADGHILKKVSIESAAVIIPYFPHFSCKICSCYQLPDNPVGYKIHQKIYVYNYC